MASVSVSIAEVPITVKRGDNATLSFVYKRKETADSVAVPQDLSAYSCRMQVRQDEGKPVRLECSTEDGTIVLGTDGSITITITKEASSAIKSGDYFYDLEFSYGLLQRRTFLTGQFVVLPEYTRED